MRIDLAKIDPRSAFARRLAEALARDGATPSKRLALMHGARGGGKSVAADVWHNEESLQRAAVEMIDATVRPGVLVFHPANGGKRSKAEAGRFKALGVRAGIPDLVFVIDGNAHGIELKTKKGTQSATQKAMTERWRRAGGEYEIARSLGEVRVILTRWGALRTP